MKRDTGKEEEEKEFRTTTKYCLCCMYVFTLAEIMANNLEVCVKIWGDFGQ